jgi:coproporphyrinogen III oxidase-like Fe-S oxidoreductase
LGPSAHSFQAGSRWWNVRSIKKYCRLLAEGKAPVEASEILYQEQLDFEALAPGLRTSDGASLHAPGGGLRSGKALEELQKSNLVRVNNGKIQPTRKGFLAADSLPLMFYS